MGMVGFLLSKTDKRQVGLPWPTHHTYINALTRLSVTEPSFYLTLCTFSSCRSPLWWLVLLLAAQNMLSTRGAPQSPSSGCPKGPPAARRYNSAKHAPARRDAHVRCASRLADVWPALIHGARRQALRSDRGTPPFLWSRDG